jgi:hypothetical protein
VCSCCACSLYLYLHLHLLPGYIGYIGYVVMFVLLFLSLRVFLFFYVVCSESVIHLAHWQSFSYKDLVKTKSVFCVYICVYFLFLLVSLSWSCFWSISSSCSFCRVDCQAARGCRLPLPQHKVNSFRSHQKTKLSFQKNFFSKTIFLSGSCSDSGRDDGSSGGSRALDRTSGAVGSAKTSAARDRLFGCCCNVCVGKYKKDEMIYKLYNECNEKKKQCQFEKGGLFRFFF